MFSLRVLNIILAGSLSTGLLAPPARAASEAVVHSFQGPPNDGSSPYYAGLVDVGGTLYGTTEFGGANGVHSFKGAPNDGSNPQAGLINVGGVLYGTTVIGGKSNNGTVFKLKP